MIDYSKLENDFRRTVLIGGMANLYHIETNRNVGYYHQPILPPALREPLLAMPVNAVVACLKLFKRPRDSRMYSLTEMFGCYDSFEKFVVYDELTEDDIAFVNFVFDQDTFQFEHFYSGGQHQSGKQPVATLKPAVLLGSIQRDHDLGLISQVSPKTFQLLSTLGTELSPSELQKILDWVKIAGAEQGGYIAKKKTQEITWEADRMLKDFAKKLSKGKVEEVVHLIKDVKTISGNTSHVRTALATKLGADYGTDSMLLSFLPGLKTKEKAKSVWLGFVNGLGAAFDVYASSKRLEFPDPNGYNGKRYEREVTILSSNIPLLKRYIKYLNDNGLGEGNWRYDWLGEVNRTDPKWLKWEARKTVANVTNA